MKGAQSAVSGANVSLLDTTITGCEAGNDGGAIYADGKLFLERVTLSDNRPAETAAGSTIPTRRRSSTPPSAATWPIPNATAAAMAEESIPQLFFHRGSDAFAVHGGCKYRRQRRRHRRDWQWLFQGPQHHRRGEHRDWSAPAPTSGGSFTSLGHNLIGDGTDSTGFTDDVNGDQVGTSASPLLPVLAPLADYGGQTMTRPPLLGSPAIDAGDTEATEFLFVDQKKDPRRNNDEVDIGAAEYIPQLTHAESIDVTAAEVLAPLVPQTASVRIHRNSAIGSLDVPLTLEPVADSAGFTDFVLVVSGPGSVTQTETGATVTIPAGQFSVLLLVQPVDDSAIEPVEDVVLIPGSDGFSRRDTAEPLPAEVDITDNDFLVTNYANAGAGSLRATIIAINGGTTGGSIFFDNELGTPHSETINLTAQLNITGAVEIVGPVTPGARLTLHGGGVTRVLNVAAGGHLELRNVTVSNGFAPNGGGLNMLGSTAVVENCLFRDNLSTGRGGAIDSTSGTLTITNSTFSTNRANTDGGAVCSAAGVSVTLQNCTVFANFADEDNNATGAGGGLAGMGGGANELVIKSTIVAGNISRSGSGPDLFNAVTSLGHNLIGNNDDVAFQHPAGSPNANNDYVGAPGSILNALLGTLQDNGGPTFTRTLLGGSPAIDKGISNALATDQRLQPRTFNFTSIVNAPGGDGTDIGAVERGNTAPIAADNAADHQRRHPARRGRAWCHHWRYGRRQRPVDRGAGNGSGQRRLVHLECERLFQLHARREL